MASKRSRATYEADLQAQQSPYVLYGTPLPPLDPDVRDDGSYMPVWKQEVTDEQGRKRLHGAFTGGFSAGYFNTVGSKEGWTPSTFSSSRSNRNKDELKVPQRPEDFMDEEDIAEAEEAKSLRTTDAFAGLTSTAEGRGSGDTLMGILRPQGETMGVRLLRKMGWKEGQGIGPKVRRRAKLEDGQQAEDGETRLFAPENSGMIPFIRKTDRKGLGFAGEQGLSKSGDALDTQNSKGIQEEPDSHLAFGPLSNGKSSKERGKVKYKNRSGFGVGILNDNGSDEEDPYSIGPQLSYNRVIGGDKKKKKKADAMKSTANPLLNNKPVFISKKAAAAKGNPGLRPGNDGRLQIDGFVLSTLSDALKSILTQDTHYPPPEIPSGWKSSKLASPETPVHETSDPTSFNRLDPTSRAALLGEKPLPSKSVFDFITPAARSRIAIATSNQSLPPARSEAPPAPSKPDPLSQIPHLPKETALAALGRGTGGWMPYADDTAKRTRYVDFLEHVGGLHGDAVLPLRNSRVLMDDWIKELQEFAHAAAIFKPMSGAMASRFSSSSSPSKMEDSTTGELGTASLLRQAKGKTPAEEAAAAEMYGPLTRSVKNWYPTRLLCKRFNVRPPTHVEDNPDVSGGKEEPRSTHSTALPQNQLELVGKKEMDELRRGGMEGMRSLGFTSGGTEGGSERLMNSEDGPGDAEEKSVAEAQLDIERNEAIEKERPGEAVFKAIFGSDSEDD